MEQKTTNKLLEVLLDRTEAQASQLTDIEKILVHQEANLREHMRRTDAAEESLALLREQIKPLEKHKSMIDGALKLIGLIGIIAGIAVACIEILNFLRPQ